jgi:hypothetical protein
MAVRLSRARAIGWGCAGLLLAQLASAPPAAAKRTQAQLTATFKDRDFPATAGAKPAPACTARFTDIVDIRRSPEMAGVIGQRGVLAPQDVQAWLRAVLGGLNARGVKPDFGADATVENSAPTVSFTLQTAWIASTTVTYSASVVIQLKAHGAAGQSLDKSYRGNVSRTAYWSGGVDTLQSAIDGAFADALDAMAVDLRTLCEV